MALHGSAVRSFPGAHIVAPYVAGDKIINNANGVASTTQGLTYAADRLDTGLFFPSQNLVVSEIAIDVQTAAAGNARICLYADNGGVPGALLDASSDLDTGTTGLKTLTKSFTFQRDTRYWIGVHTSAAPSIRALNLAAALGLGYDSAGLSFAVYRLTAAYASGAPASALGVKTAAQPAAIIFTAA